MRSIVRARPSSTELLLRILDRPELVAAVRELPAPATTEQIQGVFDGDLWRAAVPRIGDSSAGSGLG